MVIKIEKLMHSRLIFLIAMVVGVACTQTKETRPNILLIISDDQGYADYSAYGGAPDVTTPNMDRIANEGILFTNGYATAPVCNASRQGLITGAYQQRWGTWYYGGHIFPDSVRSLPELLKLNGYRCVKIGKTHYADILDNNDKIKDATSYREFPLNHGYEEFMGFCAHRHDYFKVKEKDNWVQGSDDDRMSQFGPLWRNRNKEDFDGYTTDIFGDEAVVQIKKEDERPFFMELSFNAVHHPIYQAPEKYLKQFGIEKFPDWNPEEESFMDYHARTCWRQVEDPVGRLRYLANLACLDDNIGKILKALDESGKRSNTLIVFVSDNGGSQNTYANNGILNGHKYILREGGTRTVFTMCWPEKLSPNQTIHHPVSHMDILPTCLAAAQITRPANQVIDGKNLLPLTSDSTLIHHSELIWDTGNEWAVRKGNWKLHVVKKNNHFRTIHLNAGTYLYDLHDDPGEKNNLIETHPEIVQQLTEVHNNWKINLKK
jgi:arylsulfatase A-like enzyme